MKRNENEKLKINGNEKYKRMNMKRLKNDYSKVQKKIIYKIL